MIKAIIFDMNGVIVDDEKVHEMAFCDALHEYHIDLTHENYLSYCAGKTDRRGFEEIAQAYGRDLPVEELLVKKSEKYFSLFPRYKRSYDGTIDLIKNCAERYIVALTSSSSRREIDLIIKEFGVAQCFVLTVSADDVTYGKPHPEPYVKTAELLHVKPHECLVIEDSRSGVRSAKTAGCYCIAITTTHDAEVLREADVIVDSFDEINDVVIQRFNS